MDEHRGASVLDGVAGDLTVPGTLVDPVTVEGRAWLAACDKGDD
jgi:hypothetical protein